MIKNGSGCIGTCGICKLTLEECKEVLHGPKSNQNGSKRRINMALKVICDKCDKVTTNPHKLQIIDHGEIKKEWDLCDNCYPSIAKLLHDTIKFNKDAPEYPCVSCCSPEDRAACCGCDKERKWQEKYGTGSKEVDDFYE